MGGFDAEKNRDEIVIIYGHNLKKNNSIVCVLGNKWVINGIHVINTKKK